MGGRGGGIGGLGMLLPLFSRFGWKGILIGVVLVVAFTQFGVCQGGGSSPGNQAMQTSPEDRPASDDEMVRFVGFVFDDAQESWTGKLDRYKPAKMVVFEHAASTGCGRAPSSVGPFYCPSDQTVYIDLSFYQELNRRVGAPGDFAQAYVIGHELGHHVQNLYGRLDSGSNKESIEVELQADCLAGVWARDAEKRGLLEAGDLAEALDAAAAIGDDAIQQQTTGKIHRESWTHGSSAQREKAFRTGHEGGNASACGL